MRPSAGSSWDAGVIVLKRHVGSFGCVGRIEGGKGAGLARMKGLKMVQGLKRV